MHNSYISTSSEGVFTHNDDISICSDVIAFLVLSVSDASCFYHLVEGVSRSGRGGNLKGQKGGTI